MPSALDALFARSVRTVALAAGASFELVDADAVHPVFAVTFEVGEGGREVTARLATRLEPDGNIGIDVQADYRFDDTEAAAECANIVAGVTEWIAFERMRFEDFAEMRANLARHRSLDAESPGDQAWIAYEQDGYEAHVSVYAIVSEHEEWVVFRSTLCDEDDWSAERALEESAELPYAMIGLTEGEYVLFYSLPLDALSLGRTLDIADSMGGTALRLMQDIFEDEEDDE